MKGGGGREVNRQPKSFLFLTPENLQLSETDYISMYLSGCTGIFVLQPGNKQQPIQSRKLHQPREAYPLPEPCHDWAHVPTWFFHAPTYRAPQHTTFSRHTSYYPQWDLFTCSHHSEQKFIVKLSAWAQTNIQGVGGGRKRGRAPIHNYKICRQSPLLTIKKWEQV